MAAKRKRQTRKTRKKRIRNPDKSRFILGIIFFILALCVLFRRSYRDAVILRWMSVCFPGFIGYGYNGFLIFIFFRAAGILGADIVLYGRSRRPVMKPLAATLAIPVVWGAMGHLQTNLPLRADGWGGVLSHLWLTGQEMRSGGVLGGLIAEIGGYLLPKPVILILLAVLFLWLILLSMRQSPASILNLMESVRIYDKKLAAEDKKEKNIKTPVRQRERAAGKKRVQTQSEPDEPFWTSFTSGPDEDELSTGDRRTSKRKNGIFARLSGWLSGFGRRADGSASDLKSRKSKKAGPYWMDWILGRLPGWARLKRNPDGAKRKKSARKRNERAELPAESSMPDASGDIDDINNNNINNIDNININMNQDPAKAGGKSNQADDKKSRQSESADAKSNRRQSGQAKKPAVSLEKQPDKSPDPDKKLNIKKSPAYAGEYHGPNFEKWLNKSPAPRKGETDTEFEIESKRLTDTLRSFGVRAIPEGKPVRGPSVTRYDFKLAKGTKLNKVTGLADDIAMVHGWERVRIAPIPNRYSVIGIEAPNRNPVPVLLLDVLKSPEFSKQKNISPTAFALGRDINGKNIAVILEQLPHMLIAGTTGSGKSVCMNCLIISMLGAKPDEVSFIMIDPKMVELAPYNGIPHLLYPVVTDPKKASGALQWAVREMLNRYKIFSENGVKKLEEYNQLVRGKKKTDGGPMPSVIVVIDELADLMIAAAKEVEESIMRIAQMGRAAGIHLVIATQRPSADVITGLMKANIPSRIAFAVASSMESRIILDTTGAEKLVGRGDMLYAPLGGGRIRVQGCYISPREIEDILTEIKSRNPDGGDYYQSGKDDLKASIEAETPVNMKIPEKETRPENGTDELLPAAVEIVLETEQASVSMLQRRLKLGYSRAARLIDRMEEKNYVGPFEGSRPRKILITPEQWENEKRELVGKREI